jgi:uncharacterized membrane protein
MATFNSALSQQSFQENEKVKLETVTESIFALILKENPTIKKTDFISIQELNIYRHKYISTCLSKDYETLSSLKAKVESTLKEEAQLNEQLELESTVKISYGQRIADKVASFGGSWTFIISFGIFIVIWITSNAFLLLNKGFDPYPFILLNLILSCLAAMQAPIIMMSQNRQEEKDRDRAQKDYVINLKSEMEIRILHEKMDHLILKQQLELFEIQQEQMQMLGDIWKQINKN